MAYGRGRPSHRARRRQAHREDALAELMQQVTLGDKRCARIARKGCSGASPLYRWQAELYRWQTGRHSRLDAQAQAHEAVRLSLCQPRHEGGQIDACKDIEGIEDQKEALVVEETLPQHQLDKGLEEHRHEINLVDIVAETAEEARQTARHALPHSHAHHDACHGCGESAHDAVGRSIDRHGCHGDYRAVGETVETVSEEEDAEVEIDQIAMQVIDVEHIGQHVLQVGMIDAHAEEQQRHRGGVVAAYRHKERIERHEHEQRGEKPQMGRGMPCKPIEALGIVGE